MKTTLECPVDGVTINENKARFTAFFVLVLAIVFYLTQMWAIFLFMTVDFILRVFQLEKFSPLAFLSGALVKQLKIKYKPTDRAPKRFAAGVGMIFSVAILMLWVTHLTTQALTLNAVLVVFAFLEAFIGFCAGCYVYTYGIKFSQLFKKQQIK